MRRRYKANAAVAAPAATDLASNGYPSEGNPATNTPATILGPYWFHLVTEAIVTVIEDANLVPDDTSGQFLAALKIVAAAQAPDLDYATNAEALAGAVADKVINPIALKHVIDELIGGAPGALDTLNELAEAISDDADYAATVTNALALKAPLASPALTGNPTAPTQAQDDDSTRLATTAFVKRAASSDAILATDIALASGVRATQALSESLDNFRWIEILAGDADGQFDYTLRVQRDVLQALTLGFYALVTSDNVGNAQFYSVNPATAAFAAIGSPYDLSGGNGFEGMDLAYHDGTLYALAEDTRIAGIAIGSARLYSVNPATAAFTVIGGPHDFSTWADIGVGLASHGGTLYALVTSDNVGNAQLYSVDPTTAAFTAIGSTHNFISDLTLTPGIGLASHSGTLYALVQSDATGNAKLYSVDPATGAPTAIGSSHDFVDNTSALGCGLASGGGTLYALVTGDSTGGGQLYSVDPATAVFTAIGNIHDFSTHAGMGIGLESTGMQEGETIAAHLSLDRVSANEIGIVSNGKNSHINQIIGIR